MSNPKEHFPAVLSIHNGIILNVSILPKMPWEVEAWFIFAERADRQWEMCGDCLQNTENFAPRWKVCRTPAIIRNSDIFSEGLNELISTARKVGLDRSHLSGGAESAPPRRKIVKRVHHFLARSVWNGCSQTCRQFFLFKFFISIDLRQITVFVQCLRMCIHGDSRRWYSSGRKIYPIHDAEVRRSCQWSYPSPMYTLPCFYRLVKWYCFLLHKPLK